MRCTDRTHAFMLSSLARRMDALLVFVRSGHRSTYGCSLEHLCTMKARASVCAARHGMACGQMWHGTNKLGLVHVDDLCPLLRRNCTRNERSSLFTVTEHTSRTRALVASIHASCASRKVHARPAGVWVPIPVPDSMAHGMHVLLLHALA